MGEPSPIQFLHAIADHDIKNSERAVALLWWHSITDHNTAMSANVLAKELEGCGYARQNVSRLREALEKDKRTAKGIASTFRIKISSRKSLDETYLPLVNYKPVRPTDSVLPAELVRDTRDYIARVVAQLNASYDSGLYDCCAVMSRRLLETLIIETYEYLNIANQIKDDDGNFLMFSGLLSQLEKNKSIHLSRNAKQGLYEFKRLGDLSAHNRRFNARIGDIDKIRNGLRVATEELLHLSGLVK